MVLDRLRFADDTGPREPEIGPSPLDDASPANRPTVHGEQSHVFEDEKNADHRTPGELVRRGGFDARPLDVQREVPSCDRQTGLAERGLRRKGHPRPDQVRRTQIVPTVRTGWRRRRDDAR